jgi:hypothetical protein
MRKRQGKKRKITSVSGAAPYWTRFIQKTGSLEGCQLMLGNLQA